MVKGGDGVEPQNKSLLTDFFQPQVTHLTKRSEKSHGLSLSQYFHFLSCLGILGQRTSRKPKIRLCRIEAG